MVGVKLKYFFQFIRMLLIIKFVKILMISVKQLKNERIR